MDTMVTKNNQKILTLLSNYLNNWETSITTNQIKKLTKLGISETQAFSLLLQNHLEIDDQALINEYFPLMINSLNENKYLHNPYYQNIHFSNKKLNNWCISVSSYKAYEAFVCNDFCYLDDGRVIPQIGFFNKPFYYPAVYEKGRLWMSVTPNEIETMQDSIDEACGHVVTFGLGLGYYAYMVSLKDEVTEVTVVEQSEDVIKLFTSEILPQFTHSEKIKIVKSDAFCFLDNPHNLEDIDYLFIDIWHDVSDGKNLYLKFKTYEKHYPQAAFRYWIEKTIKYYL